MQFLASKVKNAEGQVGKILCDKLEIKSKQEKDKWLIAIQSIVLSHLIMTMNGSIGTSLNALDVLANPGAHSKVEVAAARNTPKPERLEISKSVKEALRQALKDDTISLVECLGYYNRKYISIDISHFLFNQGCNYETLSNSFKNTSSDSILSLWHHIICLRHRRS
ncbi:MAG: hypothetical protein HRU19_28700 [Pseudobacteriovorax sp.]|nr:hypothetical protein [Pseudobacteriovorax sp.]